MRMELSHGSLGESTSNLLGEAELARAFLRTSYFGRDPSHSNIDEVRLEASIHLLGYNALDMSWFGRYCIGKSLSFLH